jgi:NADH:ubiquinone oxidoreductase subunit H|tara:strand:- start:1003 stop:1236 length:234 start_codon:yes stop_codon:yes gene_type:complete
MNQDSKDIITVLASIYKIPGTYFILGIMFLGGWKLTMEFNPSKWAILILICAIFCFIIEFISPAFAGRRLLKKYCLD